MIERMISSVKNADRAQWLHNAVTGIVLAGGKGERLGSPKALIKIGGQSLLLRIVNLLRSLFDEVLVVSGDKGQHAVGWLVPEPAWSGSGTTPTTTPETLVLVDEVAGIGPIGGLTTALRNMKNERGLCVACDMPFLDRDLIKYLVSLSNSKEAVVPCVGGEFEPLSAVYSRRCLKIAERRISRRQYSLTGLILAAHAHYVHIPFGPGALSFFNINTPQDLALAERIYAKTGGKTWMTKAFKIGRG